MLEFYFFIVCICIGSFINVLVIRLPKNEDVIMKRSYCPHCKQSLGFFDLIPIFSYLFLRGKCRYCQNKISFQYPLVELLTVVLGIYCLNQLGLNISMVSYFILFSILIVISMIDMRTMTIPDSCNFILVVLSLIRIFVLNLNLYEHLFYACLIVLGIGIINCIKVSFGGGDIKLLFALGLYFSKYVILIFIISIFIGSIYAVYLLIVKKVDRKTFFPFGPFLSLASFVFVFFGNDLIRWYIYLN